MLEHGQPPERVYLGLRAWNKIGAPPDFAVTETTAISITERGPEWHVGVGAAPVTWGNMDSIFKSIYLPAIRDQLNSSTNMLKLFEKESKR